MTTGDLAMTHVNVSESGAVLLGAGVACDGFHRLATVRVQTHVHEDHMDAFESSKGCQDIVMSRETRDLLIAEYNADLEVRENLHVADEGVPLSIMNQRITLYANGHMLGAVQVKVELPDGTTLGYSGDFQWPSESEAMKVDALVLDSTYGDPMSHREFGQDEAEGAFQDLVVTSLQRGPVFIHGHRGTIQRAIRLVVAVTDRKLICSERMHRELRVYRRYGWAIPDLLVAGTPAARAALREPSFVRFYGRGDHWPVSFSSGTVINLGGKFASRRDPIVACSEEGSPVPAYVAALSNHADFKGTLDYVRATGAKFVLTDNTRGGHGEVLARAIVEELGIPARASVPRRRGTGLIAWGI